jgi:hypothetical protein
VKYAYSSDGERYTDEFDSREEAAFEAVTGNANYEPGEETWVWTAEIERPSIGEFAPDGDWLIEQLTDSERNEQPDCAQDWLHATPEQRQDLESMIADAIDAWADKHGLQPTWFVANNPEKTAVVVPWKVVG